MKKRIRSLAFVLAFVLLAIGLMGCGDVSTDGTASVAITTESVSESASEENRISEAEEQESISTDAAESISNELEEASLAITEDGTYSSKDEVALYLHLYAHLPNNYLTKKEAEALGWDSSSGNLWEVAPGMSIGGNKFGNYEGLLPEADDRQYYECDIDYEGGYRNAKRIIYSNDGLIFYTEDHYASFEQIY